MKRAFALSAVVASAAVLAGFNSAAHAGLNATNHSEWDEDYFYEGFGGPAPAGAVEYSVGFSTIGDYDGRVLSNCAVTTNKVDSSPLTTIDSDVFEDGDANLYEFQITDPSAFSASVTSSTLVLALFSANGTGIAASIGGAGDALTAANTGVTSPGIYYLGIASESPASAIGYPENNEGQNIFGMTSTPGVYTPAAGITDLLLSTDPSIAWTYPGSGAAAGLLYNTSFLAGGSVITLGGSGFAVVPEPASMGLLLVGGVGLLARRRKARA
ncbi:MAG TPA: PEP-CTERM sorting domain-containing protein [Tepidisphaeraceae bacterium]|nr:PEP-CTERM sorting domain-containing protein [Tepidisphaeraceae bacterium]